MGEGGKSCMGFGECWPRVEASFRLAVMVGSMGLSLLGAVMMAGARFVGSVNMFG